jgi:two-component system, sensor histidine kinase PdtaS
MSNSMSVVQFPESRQSVRGTRQNERLDALTAELLTARARGQALREDIGSQLQRHNTLMREFENRLLNSLEMIASQLSLQSRIATTREAAAQLSAAARRIATTGRSSCRLSRSDQ